MVRKPKRLLFFIGSGILIISIILIIYFDLFNFSDKNKYGDIIDKNGRIPIAVMPFRNMTNDTNLYFMQEGIQDILMNVLANYSTERLIIRQTESISDLLQNKGIINYASITPAVASTISQKLDANLFIQGNLYNEGTTIRIDARLIDSKTEEVFKSFQLEGNSEKIMHVIDSLSEQIRDFLLITILKKDNVEYQNLASTNSPEAYRYFILGKNARLESDYATAVEWFKQALDRDSNFTIAMRLMSYSYGNQGLYKDAKKWILKLYKKRDIMSLQEKIWTDKTYAEYFVTPYETIKYLKQLQKIDDQSPILYFNLGLQYQTLQQYDKAIPEYEKMWKILDKWGSKPFSMGYYVAFAIAFHETGQNRKEKKIFRILLALPLTSFKLSFH
jgi:TolB-like protein